MLCVRCSHTLPLRADRCVRCFALNPDNRPAAAPRALHDSGPAAPVEVSIASDPPMAAVEISFDDDREPAPQASAVTEPDPTPVLTPRFALPAGRRARPAPPSKAKPAPLRRTQPALPFDFEPALPFDFKPALPFVAEPALPVDVEPPLPFEPEPAAAPAHLFAPPRASSRVPTISRLLAWSLDAALIGATTAACVAASLRVSHVKYPLDFLREMAPLFCALVCVTSVAYAALLIALCSRTPGMALAGHHLRTLEGTAPTASEALLRAVLALPSAALGLFGFTLALFDRRGQTLHDKLCRCVVIVD